MSNKNTLCCLFVSSKLDLRYAISILENGYSSLRIAKTEEDTVFDDILIKHHLNSFQTAILAFNSKNYESKFNKIDECCSLFPPVEINSKKSLILFFEISKNYKDFFYFIIKSFSKKKSKLFNLLTRMKICLNLRLYFSMKIFLNKFQSILNHETITDE